MYLVFPTSSVVCGSRWQKHPLGEKTGRFHVYGNKFCPTSDGSIIFIVSVGCSRRCFSQSVCRCCHWPIVATHKEAESSPVLASFIKSIGAWTGLSLQPLDPQRWALWEGMAETLVEGGVVGGRALVCLDTMNSDTGQEQVSLLLFVCVCRSVLCAKYTCNPYWHWYSCV